MKVRVTFETFSDCRTLASEVAVVVVSTRDEMRESSFRNANTQIVEGRRTPTEIGFASLKPKVFTRLRGERVEGYYVFPICNLPTRRH